MLYSLFWLNIDYLYHFYVTSINCGMTQELLNVLHRDARMS